MNNNFKVFIKNILLVFAVLSIGIVIGKHSVKKQESSMENIEKHSQDTIIVYYFHATFRCVTCNTIEKMAKEMIFSNYKKQIASGIIKWSEADYEQNAELASKFKVLSSCVVVATQNSNNILRYDRLDKVWTLMEDKVAFNRYIKNSIEKQLAKIDGDKK